MRCTVNDIRVRLGRIMEAILDDEINQKYRSITFFHSDLVGTTFDKETNDLVLTLSQHLYQNDYWKKILLSVKPEVLSTFIIRYHILSTSLAERNQFLPANVPEQDSEFFVVMMNQLWKSV